jgi:hypothetical protein
MYDWSFVDLAVGISLRENESSMEVLHQQCEQVGLPLVHLVVDRHPDGGKAGCFNSHQLAMRMAIERNAKTLLVFEDDARFYPDRISPAAVRSVQDFVQSDPHWGVVYLGYMPHACRTIYHGMQGMAKCNATWMSHAYLVSLPYMQTLSVLPYKDVHFDAALENAVPLEHRHVVYPMLYYQDDRAGCGTSLTWLLTKLMPIRDATKFQEHISYHYGYMVLLIIVPTLCFLLIGIFILKYLCSTRSGTKSTRSGTKSTRSGTKFTRSGTKSTRG